MVFAIWAWMSMGIIGADLFDKALEVECSKEDVQMIQCGKFTN